MGEKTDWKTPVIVFVAVLVVAIIIWAVVPKKVELEPLTENDFKILSAGWNEYDMKYVEKGLIPEIPKKSIDWEKECNYCLTGMLGNSDMFKDTDKEIRCTYYEANFLLQSSRNLSGNSIIDGIKHDTYYYFNGIHLNGISDGLRIDKDHDIIFCAKNADAYSNEDHEEICKSITLPAKCPLN